MIFRSRYLYRCTHGFLLPLATFFCDLMLDVLLRRGCNSAVSTYRENIQMAETVSFTKDSHPHCMYIEVEYSFVRAWDFPKFPHWTS